MTRQIFINLPVVDLNASKDFYQRIGFDNNAHFTDETAAGMAWSDTINVMLLTHDKWRQFTSRPIPPTSASEVMLAIALENRSDVDAMADAAAKAGGTADINPAQDMGFMYSRAIADLDGHIWEAFWMDASAMAQQE